MEWDGESCTVRTIDIYDSDGANPNSISVLKIHMMSLLYR
jgi:hypothetical protein